jgi:hypothetical protein
MYLLINSILFKLLHFHFNYNFSNVEHQCQNLYFKRTFSIAAAHNVVRYYTQVSAYGSRKLFLPSAGTYVPTCQPWNQWPISWLDIPDMSDKSRGQSYDFWIYNANSLEFNESKRKYYCVQNALGYLQCHKFLPFLFPTAFKSYIFLGTDEIISQLTL